MPVSTDTTVSAAATDGKIESLVVTGGSGYTNGTYYAAVYGDGASAGTSSGAVIRITVSGNAIQSFGLTAGTDTTIKTTAMLRDSAIFLVRRPASASELIDWMIDLIINTTKIMIAL